MQKCLASFSLEFRLSLTCERDEATSTVIHHPIALNRNKPVEIKSYRLLTCVALTETAHMIFLFDLGLLHKEPCRSYRFGLTSTVNRQFPRFLVVQDCFVLSIPIALLCAER